VQQYNEGGTICWGQLDYVDACANNIHGLTASAGFDFNNWRLCDGWIE